MHACMHACIPDFWPQIPSKSSRRRLGETTLSLRLDILAGTVRKVSLLRTVPAKCPCGALVVLLAIAETCTVHMRLSTGGNRITHLCVRRNRRKIGTRQR